MKYTPGQLVKFTRPVDADEAKAVMVVVEDRDNNVLVTDQRHASWPVPPTAVYAKSELTLAGAQS